MSYQVSNKIDLEELLISKYPSLTYSQLLQFIDLFKATYVKAGYYYPSDIRSTLNKSYRILDKLKVIILGDTKEFYYNLEDSHIQYWSEFFIPPFDSMRINSTFVYDLHNILDQGVGIYNLYPTHCDNNECRKLWNDFVLGILDRDYVCTPILCTNLSLPDEFKNKFHLVPFDRHNSIGYIQSKLVELNRKPLRIYD